MGHPKSYLKANSPILQFSTSPPTPPTKTTMITPNPMAETYPTAPRAISQETHCIAGILTTVYGLAELNKEIKEVACLWLLHPRLQTQSCMAPIAASTIHAWNDRQRKNKTKKTNLIAISFDQRNHGTREVDNMANEAWRSGNERHAQDMFASYRKCAGYYPFGADHHQPVMNS